MELQVYNNEEFGSVRTLPLVELEKKCIGEVKI